MPNQMSVNQYLDEVYGDTPEDELLEALIECEKWIATNTTLMAEKVAELTRCDKKELVKVWLQENKTLQHAREVIKNHEG
jgi:hypothetical protein